MFIEGINSAGELSDSLTVYIPTYNREHVISNAICGLLAQKFRDFHIVVVDNGSDDQTRDVVRYWADRVQDIKVIYERKDRTVPTYLNLYEIATKDHSSRYFMLHGDDDILVPDALGSAVRCLDACPNALFLGMNQFVGTLWYLGDKFLVPPDFSFSTDEEICFDLLPLADLAGYYGKFNSQSFVTAYIYRNCVILRRHLVNYDRLISRNWEDMRLKIGYMMPYTFALFLLMNAEACILTNKVILRGMDLTESRNLRMMRPKDSIKNALDYSVSVLKFMQTLLREEGFISCLSPESRSVLIDNICFSAYQLRDLLLRTVYEKGDIMKTYFELKRLLSDLGATSDHLIRFFLVLALSLALAPGFYLFHGVRLRLSERKHVFKNKMVQAEHFWNWMKR